ncbi:MAG TPA: baseplate J/gp47 family protein [Solirubrobacteraceae bacterium]|nr:baseplate J/gp47 family protein [Solirubrobacteraceae bacterium]
MSVIVDTDAREARAAGLAARNLNGFDFVLVSLPATGALLEVHFLNAHGLPAVLAASAPARSLFPIAGGHRAPAGPAPGDVQAAGVFALVAGSTPIRPDGLAAPETLTIAVGGTTTTVALAAGATPATIAGAVETTAGVRALPDGGRIVILARTFDLAVSSSRADARDGRSSGFGTAAVTPAPDVLGLLVQPVGDYSTYTLGTGAAVAAVDPLFDELPFKFRPGCFSTDCAPAWTPAPARPSQPVIDYLAKDYDSFRHVAMSWMQARVPGWTPSSEADLSQTLLSLLSAAADELSDYQDRVMNEAYLATARSRVSLARHARLMDYHVHQGNQAVTWLAAELGAGQELQAGGAGGDPATIEAWAGRDGATAGDDAAVFRGATPRLHHLLNAVRLHTWSGVVSGLAAGAITADLAMPSRTAAETVAELIADGAIPQLLIQQHRDPLTGNPAGADPDKRQLLRLDPAAAAALRDPVADTWYVTVAWRDEDRLRHDHPCETHTPNGVFADVSVFHGNLVEVRHGRLRTVTFQPPGSALAPGERHLEPTQRWGMLARLDPDAPLLYRDTLPRSEQPPLSTLSVTDAEGREWAEVISLVDSEGTDLHFAVETDELDRSTIRFGTGVHGENLATGVTCTYQTGIPLAGNVGRDRIVRFAAAANPKLAAVWNPFDVSSARAPEPRDEIVRNAPEAYRARQLRAITLADYVQRAEEVPGVARAAAAYAWTGSWRTVQVTIDPAGTETLRPELRAAVARALEPVRLIGEDLELRAPLFVPLRVVLAVCAEPDVWLDDVRAVLEQEYSDGYTPDGRPGFFHPDAWTFGQTLHASQILGRLEHVPGIAFARSVRLGRWNAPTPGSRDRVTVAANEIIRVHNDPDHMELGSIVFDLAGGRR